MSVKWHGAAHTVVVSVCTECLFLQFSEHNAVVSVCTDCLFLQFSEHNAVHFTDTSLLNYRQDHYQHQFTELQTAQFHFTDASLLNYRQMHAILPTPVY